MNERESLLVLMDKALKSKTEIFKDWSLEEIIVDEKKCASVLRNVLNDESFQIPNGERYKIVQGRAEHSIINYALGLVFCEFADLFECIDRVMEKHITEGMKTANEVWFYVALNHDVGYFHKSISDQNLDYEKKHKYYLFKDKYEDTKYDCLNGMSYKVPELYAFTYSEILEYDKKDRERRQKDASNCEKINHGIYGGVYYFDRMLCKFEKEKNVESKRVKMVKTVAITIAQHNIYKSNSTKDNQFYPSKLWYGSDFVIGKEYPLLLFLALIDTVECVKKLGRTNNRQSFFQAKTVLKSISVKVDRYSIEIDYSELKARLDKKENDLLSQNYKNYINSVKGLPSWTCLKVDDIENEDVLRIFI